MANPFSPEVQRLFDSKHPVDIQPIDFELETDWVAWFRDTDIICNIWDSKEALIAWCVRYSHEYRVVTIVRPI